VVDLPRKGFFSGFFAWIIWLFIHIIPIAGYRNKAKLAYNWFWSFVTNDPTLRLIIRPTKKESVLQGIHAEEDDDGQRNLEPQVQRTPATIPANLAGNPNEKLVGQGSR
jgi:hypothetical protein